MKPKKKNKPSGSIGTSSGSSSHSPVMSHDEDHVEIHQPIINQYVLDSRTSSELTSAAVPFSVSPMALNNTINESLKVHCGKTMIQPRSFSGDYNSHYMHIHVQSLSLPFLCGHAGTLQTASSLQLKQKRASIFKTKNQVSLQFWLIGPLQIHKIGCHFASFLQ